MVSRHIRKTWPVVIALLAISCIAAAALMAAGPDATASNILYTASGTFASPAVSGNDLLGLAGQPFIITVVASSSLSPTSHGAHWAQFNGLTMKGAVSSKLLAGQPQDIDTTHASIALSVGNPSYDTFQFGSQVTVVGLPLSITASITMPTGTVGMPLIRPFTAPVALSPSNATVTYSNGTASTTLAVADGILNAVTTQ
jgi:hypothetical protein